MAYAKIFNRDKVNRAFAENPREIFVTALFEGRQDDTYWQLQAKRGEDGSIILWDCEYLMQTMASAEHGSGLCVVDALELMDKWERAQLALGRRECNLGNRPHQNFRELAKEIGAIVGPDEVSRVHTRMIKSAAARKSPPFSR